MRRVLMLLCLALLLGACSSTTSLLKLPPLQNAEQVELKRYYGRWYVIANIPYRAEMGKVGTYVEYRPRSDGDIDDLYFFRKGNFNAPVERWEGVAWVTDQQSKARWKAQFIWPFRFDYLILETAPDYSWALVGHPGRDLAWVFSRTPELDSQLYNKLLEKLRERGYAPERLRRIPQRPEQMGMSGFQ